jgi:hypothetical protein
LGIFETCYLLSNMPYNSHSKKTFIILKMQTKLVIIFVASLPSIQRGFSIKWWNVFRTCLNSRKSSFKNATKLKIEYKWKMENFLRNLDFFQKKKQNYDWMCPFILISHILVKFCTKRKLHETLSISLFWFSLYPKVSKFLGDSICVLIF